MRPTDNIEKRVKQAKIKTRAEVSRHVLNDLLSLLPPADAAGKPHAQPTLWRTRMNTKLTKAAAVAAVLIVTVFVATQLIFVAPTFAEVVRPLLNARTIVYDFVTGPEDEGTLIHDIVVGSRIRRTVSNLENVTMILDIENARMLHLDNSKKQANYFDMDGPLQYGTQGFLDFIRQTIRRTQENPEASAGKLGTKDINGRAAVGFAAGGQNEKIEIWADAKTSLPEIGRASCRESL